MHPSSFESSLAKSVWIPHRGIMGVEARSMAPASLGHSALYLPHTSHKLFVYLWVRKRARGGGCKFTRIVPLYAILKDACMRTSTEFTRRAAFSGDAQVAHYRPKRFN